MEFFFKAIRWRAFGNDDDDEDSKTTRSPLEESQYRAAAFGLFASALSTSAFSNIPSISSGTAASSADFIKTATYYVPKGSNLEKLILLFSLVFLVLGVIKELQGCNSTSIGALLCLVPWAYLCVGIARAQVSKIRLFPTSISAHIPPLLAASTAFTLAEVTKGPTAAISGTLYKSSMRHFTTLLGERMMTQSRAI